MVDRIKTFKRVLRHEYGADAPYALRRVSLWQVSNWEAVFSSSHAVVSVVFYVAFMLSQLVLSYVGFLYFDVDNRPVVFVVSQLYTIVSSYFFPMVVAGAVDDSVDRPFADLSQELDAYWVFAVCVLVQVVGLLLGIWAAIVLYRGASFTIVDGARRMDVTAYIRVYQLACVNLTAMTLVAALTSWWVTRGKIERYVNRASRTQAPMPDDDHFYTRYLKTTREYKTYRVRQ